MKTLVVVLVVVSGLCSLAGVLILATQAERARKALLDPRRHTVDAGDVAGLADGPNLSTTLDDLLANVRTPALGLVTLLGGIVTGTVGNLLALGL